MEIFKVFLIDIAICVIIVYLCKTHLHSKKSQRDISLEWIHRQHYHLQYSLYIRKRKMFKFNANLRYLGKCETFLDSTKNGNIILTSCFASQYFKAKMNFRMPCMWMNFDKLSVRYGRIQIDGKNSISYLSTHFRFENLKFQNTIIVITY